MARRPRDPNQLAKMVVDIATGEAEDSISEEKKHPQPKRAQSGNTSLVERQNLAMRMGMRRFTRLTNGFSKKAENHAAMVAIHFMYYNFARIRRTLRVTPEMAAELTDHVWSLEEITLLANA
jgi:hypothetical protein